jgi:hypothetical protein
MTALPGGHDFVEVSGGGYQNQNAPSYTLARRSDGSVVTWGTNNGVPLSVPPLPAGITYVQVSTGYLFGVARRSDGSVVMCPGYPSYPYTVPTLPAGVSYVQVAAGWGHVVARRSDGIVVEWASVAWSVPPLPVGLSYVEVSAGESYSAARRSDGTLVTWGYTSYGQSAVPPLPAGLTYVQVSAGGRHVVARRSDGSAVAWGQNTYGQCNVPALPSGLTYVEVAAGFAHTVALRSDGSVVAWGQNYLGQCNVPALPVGLKFIGVAAAGIHSLALVDYDPAVVSLGTGCGGAGSPVFGCSGPRIGQNVFLSLTSGTPNAAGYVYGGGIPPSPYPLGSGCVVQVDMGSAIPFLPVVTNGTGAWWNGLLIPSNHNLVGVPIALQIALFNTSGPLGFDLSNGLIVTIGL